MSSITTKAIKNYLIDGVLLLMIAVSVAGLMYDFLK